MEGLRIFTKNQNKNKNIVKNEQFKILEEHNSDIQKTIMSN